MVLALALTGCPARRPQQSQPNSVPTAESIRGEKAAEAARQIPGVRAAWAVVVGEQAYVGIDLEGEHNRTHDANTQIEEDVSAAIRRSDAGVQDAYVTTKPEVVSSIFNIAEGLRTGQPFDRFVSELDKIYSELKPEGR